MKITKLFKFEAAHQLSWHPGKCKNLHGHSYKGEVDIEGELDSNGVVVDFDFVKKLVEKNITERYDHTYLNDFFANPTAEVMATIMLAEMQADYKNMGYPGKVVAVRLWETANNFVEAS